MSGYWSITNRAPSGNATATQAAPAKAASGGAVLRLRSITIGAGGLALQAQILDGATVIWQVDLPSSPQPLTMQNWDIRASVGNSLTVQIVGSNTTVPTDVNAQGDYVPIGSPMYMP